MNKVSMVVCTHNDIAIAEKFFEYHKPYVDEIIVADDASTDGTVEVVKKYATKSILATEWAGYCEFYWQKLADMAENDWILWMDSDQFADIPSLEKMRTADLTQPFYDYEFHNHGYAECGICLKSNFRQAKLFNRKCVRWAPYPHSYVWLVNGNPIGASEGDPFGIIDHYMTVDSVDLESHKRNHMLRMCRWYDAAKHAYLEFKDPEYAPYRERCRLIYANVKIDLATFPYMCSKYPDRLVWLSDEELWEKVKDGRAFERLIESAGAK